MFKRSEYSTYIGKVPFYFTLIVFVVTTLVSILLLLNYRNNPLAIFAIVLLIILDIASIVILFGLLTDYAYIDNDVLYMSYMFKKASIEINNIGKIELKDEIYHVFNKNNNEIGTINAKALGIEDILKKLYRNNVSFI